MTRKFRDARDTETSDAAQTEALSSVHVTAVTPSDGVLRSRTAVIAWLAVLVAMVWMMVVVGGITRLTGSGLSMVEWAPIMGVVPPLNDADWQHAFALYQQYPQYRVTHPDMTLAGFQAIFFWEYMHRVLGRGIGAVFFIPFAVFWVRGCFSRALAGRLLVALGLGALQGLLGWLMVKSGLVDQPRVSHYRLAAHLGLALTIMAYLWWVLLGIVSARDPVPARAPLRSLLMLMLMLTLALVSLQIIYGAFVAGLRAGGLFGTFPLMGDRWIGEGVMALSPWWLNLGESPATVQFIHRWLGTLLLATAVFAWFAIPRLLLSRRQGLGLRLLVMVTLVQFLLGVYTLLNGVPVAPAVMHQGCAAVLLLVAVFALHSFAPPQSGIR